MATLSKERSHIKNCTKNFLFCRKYKNSNKPYNKTISVDDLLPPLVVPYSHNLFKLHLLKQIRHIDCVYVSGISRQSSFKEKERFPFKQGYQWYHKRLALQKFRSIKTFNVVFEEIKNARKIVANIGRLNIHDLTIVMKDELVYDKDLLNSLVGFLNHNPQLETLSLNILIYYHDSKNDHMCTLFKQIGHSSLRIFDFKIDTLSYKRQTAFLDMIDNFSTVIDLKILVDFTQNGQQFIKQYTKSLSQLPKLKRLQTTVPVIFLKYHSPKTQDATDSRRPFRSLESFSAEILEIRDPFCKHEYNPQWSCGVLKLKHIEFNAFSNFEDESTSELLSILVQGLNSTQEMMPTLNLNVSYKWASSFHDAYVDKSSLLSRLSKMQKLTLLLAVNIENSDLWDLAQGLENFSDLKSLTITFEQTNGDNMDKFLDQLDVSISQLNQLEDLKLTFANRYGVSAICLADAESFQKKFLLRSFERCKFKTLILHLRAFILYTSEEVIVSFLSRMSEFKRLEVMNFSAKLLEPKKQGFEKKVNYQLSKFPKLKECIVKIE